MRKLTLYEWVEKANSTHNNFYRYEYVEYKSSRDKVKIECPSHGVFEQKANSHLLGHGCPYCMIERGKIKNSLTTKEFINRAHIVHDNRYDYSKVQYLNAHSRVIIICNEHGEFEQQAYVHLNGSGCPVCKKSKGEKTIRQWLDKHKIRYEEQKTFHECRNKRLLPFDFYLQDYNVCIEFDGKQHYEPYSWTSDKSEETKNKNLENIRSKDAIKTKYCDNNSINLIRIPYWKINKIDKELSLLLAGDDNEQ